MRIYQILVLIGCGIGFVFNSWWISHNYCYVDGPSCRRGGFVQSFDNFFSIELAMVTFFLYAIAMFFSFRMKHKTVIGASLIIIGIATNVGYASQTLFPLLGIDLILLASAGVLSIRSKQPAVES